MRILKIADIVGTQNDKKKFLKAVRACNFVLLFFEILQLQYATTKYNKDFGYYFDMISHPKENLQMLLIMCLILLIS